ncbi:MAG TPA: hypothetical protein VF599_06395 [Pyrinomonadaceae bacterium]|jgi:hypothetical protein
MKGLKKYTHADRQKAIEEIIPLVRRKFGDNLVAPTIRLFGFGTYRLCQSSL